MEVRKIVLFKKEDCPFCSALSEFIPIVLKELKVDKLQYIEIDVDKIEDDRVKNMLQARGVPFVEFRDNKDDVIFTAPGLPQINEEVMKKDGYKVDKMSLDDKIKTRIELVKHMFLVELANANVIALDRLYRHDKDFLKKEIEKQNRKIFNKAEEHKKNIFLILDKYNPKKTKKRRKVYK